LSVTCHKEKEYPIPIEQELIRMLCRREESLFSCQKSIHNFSVVQPDHYNNYAKPITHAVKKVSFNEIWQTKGSCIFTWRGKRSKEPGDTDRLPTDINDKCLHFPVGNLFSHL